MDRFNKFRNKLDNKPVNCPLPDVWATLQTLAKRDQLFVQLATLKEVNNRDSFYTCREIQRSTFFATRERVRFLRFSSSFVPPYYFAIME